MFIIKTITFIIITSNFLSFYFLPRIQIISAAVLRLLYHQ